MSYANLLSGDKTIFADGTYYAQTLETNTLQARDPIQEISLRSDLNGGQEASITGIATLEVFQLFSPQGGLVASLSGSEMFIQSLEVESISGIVIDMSGVEQRLDVIIGDISNEIVPLQTTANEILVNISNGVGALDLSVSFVETNAILTDISDAVGSLATDVCGYFDTQNSILVDISNGIGAIDLSFSLVETNAILTDICNAVGLIDTTALVDICAGQDVVISEIQSTNFTLGSINSLTTNVNDYLQPKAFSRFGTATAPALPFSGNFVNAPCVWKKLVCETAQTTIANTGFITTTFYDTSGTPTGSEPVLLRLNHPAVFTYNNPAMTSNFGTAFHDITFPDGGLICSAGIGVICVGSGATFNSVALTGYTTGI